MTHDIQHLGGQFDIAGDFVSAAPYGNGHINDTYAAVYTQNGKRVRYIFQRLNSKVFKNTLGLMDNVRRVTEHQHRKLREAGAPDRQRRALSLVPARSGEMYHVDREGQTWRVYLFIEGAQTYEVVESPVQAYEAAKAFGAFQEQLVDLPGPRLQETIPDFHNTAKRFEALEKAIETDACNRAGHAKADIAFALAHRDMTRVLIDEHAQGRIPERITHNDTKLNNVMLDATTQEGICVIDLDTVMPGLALYDFGDMVRTATSPAAEDEKDLDKVVMRMDMFEALVRGYLSSAGRFLNREEISHLAFCGKLITFEIGIRFLTDYLEGDVYFKTHRQDHNLDRCRTQFRLVRSIADQDAEMKKVVETCMVRSA